MDVNDITDEMIEKKYFNINPVGTVSIVCRTVKAKLQNNADFIVDGQPLTFEVLCDKYMRYVEYHKKKHGTNEQYIPKDQKLADPYDFVDKNMFYSKYGKSKDSRDRYLFGEFDENELRASLNRYLLTHDLPIKKSSGAKSIHVAISNTDGKQKNDEENLNFSIRPSGF